VREERERDRKGERKRAWKASGMQMNDWDSNWARLSILCREQKVRFIYKILQYLVRSE
jgi:hypothetical protein